MNFEVNDKIVPIIVAIGDHVRLSERDFKELFGDDHGELTKVLTLGQEGEWLTEERIVITSNGRATEVPIIMPFVKKTEICLCSSTLAKLKLKADLKAPNGAYRSDRVWLSYGVLGKRIEKRNSAYRPLRHIHIPLDVRNVYDINLGDTVIAEINGQRGVVLDQVVVVDSPNGLGKEIELHVDKDEAYAFGVFEDRTYAKVYIKKEQPNDDPDA